jgi:xylulokinase
VAGFADATGHFLPLVCTLNAARVLTAAAAMLGTDLAGLDRLAMSAEPGAGGLVLLPYLDGERTPDLPDATGTLGGLTRSNATPENLGGAARSLAVQEIAPSIFGASVTVPAPHEYVAVGAARQAAWALRSSSGKPDLQGWTPDTSTVHSLDDSAAGERVRTAYGEFAETVYPHELRPSACR